MGVQSQVGSTMDAPMMTPPTVSKPGGVVSAPSWSTDVPTQEEAMQYFSSAADGTAAVDEQSLPSLHARAWRWKRVALGVLGEGRQLREFQAEALAHQLLGRDVFELAPTGSGKTLTFQVPGLAEPGLT